MASTLYANVVVPEIYLPYEYKEIIEKAKWFKSGIIVPNPMISQKLDGGGDMFKVPCRILNTDDPTAIQSGTTLASSAGSTSQTNVRRFLFGKVWGEEEIASAYAGSRPEWEIPEITAQYWGNFYNKVATYCAKGIFADNIASDNSDLVNDIANADGSLATDAEKISADAIIDTAMKLLDREDAFDGGGIAMRSEVYTRLLKLKLIDFVPISDQSFGIPTYQGMTVVVDNKLPRVTAGSGYDYWTILFEKGSAGWGEGGYQFITQQEINREALDSETQLIQRKQFGMSFKGFSWATSETVASETPLLTEIDDAVNWDRVQDDARTSGMALLVTSG